MKTKDYLKMAEDIYSLSPPIVETEINDTTIEEETIKKENLSHVTSLVRKLFDIVIILMNPFIAIYNEMFKDYTAISSVRDRKLRKLIKWCISEVPFYRNKFSGIDPEDITLSQLPVVTKPMMMDNLSEFLSVQDIRIEDLNQFSRKQDNLGILYKGKYQLSITSGTTGRVGYFLHDVKSWVIMSMTGLARMYKIKYLVRYLSKHFLRRKLRRAMVCATGGPYVSYQTTFYISFVSKFLKLLEENQAFSVMTPIPEIIDGLNKFKPHLLVGYPTMLEVLANAQIDGALKINPDIICANGEPFSENAKKALKKAYPDSFVTEIYGTTEFIPVANQCSNERLHLNEDYVILEAVDADGIPVSEGTISDKIYLTNLVDRVQPIVRYEIGDSVKFTGEICECGSRLPVIEVCGRGDDTFYLMDNEGELQPFPPLPFEALFLEVEGLLQYQLVHEKQNHLIIRYVAASGFEPELVESNILDLYLEFLSLRGFDKIVHLHLDRVDEIERDSCSQKIRQIYSKV